MNEKFSGGKEQYIMFDLRVLHPDIWYWRNVISYPDELVDFINKIDEEPLSNNAISPWTAWTASNDESMVYGATKNVSVQNVKLGSENEKVDQRTLYIFNSLSMAFEMCSDRYLEGHGLDKSKYKLGIDNIPVKKWQVGASMGPHADGYDGNADLAFSMVEYLNDDYEGGEISFPNHNITIKPEKGSLIMFPSQDPFVHEVKPIISGDRYMSTISLWSV